MVQLAQSPERLARLASVLEHELGHELAFAVERGKIAVNSGSKDPAIKLDVLEAGLAVQLSDALVADSLNDHTSRLETGVQEALRLADLTAERPAVEQSTARFTLRFRCLKDSTGF